MSRKNNDIYSNKRRKKKYKTIEKKNKNGKYSQKHIRYINTIILNKKNI